MTIQDVRIDECVHYRGFLYGGFGNNIYEDYIIGLANGVSLTHLREIFIKRILAFDGTDFSSALNIQLTRRYSPWIYPWSLGSMIKSKIIYFDPTNNPDIICHSSPQGVLASHINREFSWLETAYNAMLAGYKPQTYGYINLCRLQRNNQTRYIVLDGNHRLSAMHALGFTVVKAKIYSPILCNASLSRMWPGVIFGRFTHKDAISVFNRYFENGNHALSERGHQQLILDEPLNKSC